MNEQLIALGLKLFGGIIATIIAGIVIKVLNRVEKKVNIDINNKTEERIKKIVKEVVLEVEQVYISKLRKIGRFNEEEQRKAFQLALQKTKDIIRMNLLPEPSTQELSSKIESAVGEIKGNKGYLVKDGKPTK